jgi:hypothetical protein
MSGLYDRVHLVINRGVLERVLQDCETHPTVEIGGRWFGWYIDAEDRYLYDEKLGTAHLSSADLAYVIDYIPTGPNADSKTDVELQPDREYQSWVYNRLTEVDDTIAILGSWHSHIPNGLEIFSKGDWMSYHSKLNNHNPPYPYDRMLCSLIHTEAHSVEDAETHLRHSWWPKGEEMGTHYWVDSNELTWKDDVEVPCAEIIQLDYSLYHLLRGKDRLKRKLANTRSTLADGEGRLLSEQSWLKRTMTQFFGRKVEDEQGELDHLKEKADSLEHELEEIDQQIKNHSD